MGRRDLDARQAALAWSPSEAQSRGLKLGTGEEGQRAAARAKATSDGETGGNSDSGPLLGPGRSRGAARCERPGRQMAEEEAQAPRLKGSRSARGPLREGARGREEKGSDLQPLRPPPGACTALQS